MIRAVIDTNVLFVGLTYVGADSHVVDAWVLRQFTPCVSTSLAFEYQAVMLNKLNPRRQVHAAGALQALLDRAEFVPIHYSYRPSSPDPGDDLVVDCVLNAGAVLVTHNLRDFKLPAARLGFEVLQPEELLQRL